MGVFLLLYFNVSTFFSLLIILFVSNFPFRYLLLIKNNSIISLNYIWQTFSHLTKWILHSKRFRLLFAQGKINNKPNRKRGEKKIRKQPYNVNINFQRTQQNAVVNCWAFNYYFQMEIGVIMIANATPLFKCLLILLIFHCLLCLHFQHHFTLKDNWIFLLSYSTVLYIRYTFR